MPDFVKDFVTDFVTKLVTYFVTDIFTDFGSDLFTPFCLDRLAHLDPLTPLNAKTVKTLAGDSHHSFLLPKPLAKERFKKINQGRL